MAILNYREFAAPERLRRYVRCAWHLELDADPDRVDTIYPDGCCELIAHRKYPMHALDAATGWRQQEQCLFAAQQRSAIRLSARGDVDCIGVRLHPAASALLFGGSLADLRDRIVDLASMDRKFSRQYAAAALQPDVETSVADVWKLLERRFLPLPIDQRTSDHQDAGRGRPSRVPGGGRQRFLRPGSRDAGSTPRHRDHTGEVAQCVAGESQQRYLDTVGSGIRSWPSRVGGLSRKQELLMEVGVCDCFTVNSGIGQYQPCPE